jgi:hypothetical protein
MVPAVGVNGGIMNMSSWKGAVALLMASVFLVTGCTQLHDVPLRSSGEGVAVPDVKVGDSVVARTRDGATHKFKVAAVESDALRGASRRVAYADMTSLEVARSDGQISKTALIVGAVLVGVAVAGAAGGGGGGGY